MLIKAALCLSMFTVVRGEYARHNVKNHSNCYKGTPNNYLMLVSLFKQIQINCT